jgi:hypothetical protein
VLRFAVIGALLFALFGETQGPTAPPASAGPDGDEEILLREALARGYHRSDAVVRRRLAMNLRFALDDGARSEAELVELALALGMHESDLVVRRRLVQKMELLAHGRARLRVPDEASLARYHTRHDAEFREPARTRITQAFARDPARAEQLRLRAAARPADPEALAGEGDALPIARALPPLSQEELSRVFGAAFAARVERLTEGLWGGPLASAHGLHLVFVHERMAERPAPLAAVRAALGEALLAERGARLLAEDLAALRTRAAHRAEDSW